MAKKKNPMEELQQQLLSMLDEETVRKFKEAKSPDEIADLLDDLELTDDQLALVAGGSGWSEPGDIRADYDSEKVASAFVQGELDSSIIFNET